ncbi:50S ribosomal protein L31 [Candidatus Ozemobacteraceae bacterium]|nr:50S ribosomal protein L31 [Candidatus Ozemobacteraceae bacterium]
MKAKIHPDYNKINVTCACGNSFASASTSKELKVEVCSACHPFFTGQQRFLDTAGRVERFQAKIEQHKKVAAEAEAKKASKKGAAKAKAAPVAEGVPASEK